MEYLTVKETAEIKKCSTQYIQKICKDRKIDCKTELNSKGRMKYLIPVSALSEQEQAIYYKQKRSEVGIVPEKIIDENTFRTALKYRSKGIKRPFESFSEQERQDIKFWTEILQNWQAERSNRKDKTKFDEIFVAHCKYIHPDLDISVNILYRKYHAYKNECFEGLLDGRGKYQHKTKIGDDSIIWQVFCQLYLEDSEQKVSVCYREMSAYIAEEFPELVPEIPSEMTFRRKIEKIPYAVTESQRKGAKAEHDHCQPYAIRLTDKLNANDVWVMDNYTMDILAQNEGGNSLTKRVYLTGVLDAKSFAILGWNISDSPDSQSTLIALRNAMRTYGFPKSLYVDNGREFTATALSGKRGCRKMKKQDEYVASIFERLDIEVHYAKPRNAQAKVIERAHLTFKNQFCHAFMGWCGGSIIERPESIKRHIKNGAIETEPELRETFRKYANYVYNVSDYGGEEPEYQDMTKIDVWNSSIQGVGLRMADEYILNTLMMRANGLQKVKRNGVYIPFGSEKIWYYDEQHTWEHIGEEVIVRYDPCDLREVRLYDKEDRYLFSWRCADWLMMEYIDEESEKIAKVEKTKKIVSDSIKQRAQELKGKQRITRKTGLEYLVKQGEKKYSVKLPKNIQIVTTEEPMKKAVGAEEIETVEINLGRMVRNNAKRKDESI